VIVYWQRAKIVEATFRLFIDEVIKIGNKTSGMAIAESETSTVRTDRHFAARRTQIRTPRVNVTFLTRHTINSKSCFPSGLLCSNGL